MSRIGYTPITIPAGVDVKINDNIVTVKGKLGELNYQVLPGITIKKEDNQLIFEREDDSRQSKTKHGLTRAYINNMVIGVSEGFKKELHIIGLGYSAEVVGPWLKLSMGYSHDVLIEIPNHVECVVEKAKRAKGSRTAVQAKIIVKGIDKEVVGQFAAEIRNVRRPENYKGKGIRYSDEYVRIKAGKTGTA